MSRLQYLPIGSLVGRAQQEREQYVAAAYAAPKAVQPILFRPRTSAFVTGLVRTHNLKEAQGDSVAFLILRVGVGELALSQLGAALSSEAQLANDEAQKIATEIERDLFAPVAIELNRYHTEKQQGAQKPKATANPAAAGADNVLNLKRKPSQPAAPRPPKKPTTPPTPPSSPTTPKKPSPPAPPTLPRPARRS